MEGSAACCGEVVSATGAGGSGVASRDFSEVAAASWVTTTLLFLIKGSRVEDSDDYSLTDGVPERRDLRLPCEEEVESLARLPIH